MEGQHPLLGRVLVTVWWDGSGEMIHQDTQTHWSLPTPLTKVDE